MVISIKEVKDAKKKKNKQKEIKKHTILLVDCKEPTKLGESPTAERCPRQYEWNSK